MAVILDFREEITKLEDQKWNLMLRYGNNAVGAEWNAIDAKLNRLYKWWTHTLISQGRERELPFHLRKLK